jgi:peptidoglycan/xylan/chitin deacetylase (PgdA/CDA1 family)
MDFMKAARLARWVERTGFRGILGNLMRWTGVLCLNYHRIGYPADSLFDRDLWSANPVDFEEQMRFLRSNFEVIGLADLPNVLEKKRGRHVLVTFDDGYRDNYEIAFPILKHQGVPATFFVATGFLDHPKLSWWDEIAWMVRRSPRHELHMSPWLPGPLEHDEPDRERTVQVLLKKYKGLRASQTGPFLEALATATASGRCPPEVASDMWMTWDMVRAMRAGGMTIGGHTVNHPVLASLPADEQRQEIDGCAQRLQEELGEAMVAFSYPVGRPECFNADTRASLRQCGVRYAFSYYGGYRTGADWDDHDIRRIAVETYVDRDLFRSTVCMPQIFARQPKRRVAVAPASL